MSCVECFWIFKLIFCQDDTFDWIPAIHLNWSCYFCCPKWHTSEKWCGLWITLNVSESLSQYFAIITHLFESWLDNKHCCFTFLKTAYIWRMMLNMICVERFRNFKPIFCHYNTLTCLNNCLTPQSCYFTFPMADIWKMTWNRVVLNVSETLSSHFVNIAPLLESWLNTSNSLFQILEGLYLKNDVVYMNCVECFRNFKPIFCYHNTMSLNPA